MIQKGTITGNGYTTIVLLIIPIGLPMNLMAVVPKNASKCMEAD